MVNINQKLKNEESGLVSSPKYGRFGLTASCLFCLPSLLISLSEHAAGTVECFESYMVCHFQAKIL
jgi:hypothetical protein